MSEKKDELKEFNRTMEDEVSRHLHFLLSNDSYISICWEDFDEIVTDYGFKQGYFHEFRGEDSALEKEALYYLEDKGLIVYAFTKGGISVDAANLYGEICNAPYDFMLSHHQHLKGCWHFYHSQPKTIEFFIDIREGFKLKTDTIITNFELNPNWKSHQLFSFLNYWELETKPQDILQVTAFNKVKLNKHLYDIVYAGR